MGLTNFPLPKLSTEGSVSASQYAGSDEEMTLAKVAALGFGMTYKACGKGDGTLSIRISEEGKAPVVYSKALDASTRKCVEVDVLFTNDLVNSPAGEVSNSDDGDCLKVVYRVELDSAYAEILAKIDGEHAKGAHVEMIAHPDNAAEAQILALEDGEGLLAATHSLT